MTPKELHEKVRPFRPFVDVDPDSEGRKRHLRFQNGYPVRYAEQVERMREPLMRLVEAAALHP